MRKKENHQPHRKMAAKQKVSTHRSDSDYWEYEGEHKGYTFHLRKLGGEWIGEVLEIAGTDETADLKREVVNALVNHIDDVEANSRTYEETMYEGLPIFDIKMTREADYSYSERTHISCDDDFEEFLRPFFSEMDREVVVVILMDAGNTITGIHKLSVGGLSASLIDVKNVFKPAILGNASKIALAHNHPSGNPEPSRADISITRKVKNAGETMDIPLVDHLVFGDRIMTSLRERGVI